jgi:hypothetical protein
MENEKTPTRYFEKKLEERKSVRTIEVASVSSSECYEISPYSIRHDDGYDLQQMIFGSILCVLGILILGVGVEKKFKNNSFEGARYWISCLIFLALGIYVLYKTIQAKYRLLDNYS